MPELIGKLQATFKNTLHSSPQIFSLAVYRLRGDCKSPGFISRTFLYDGLQIRRNCKPNPVSTTARRPSGFAIRC